MNIFEDLFLTVILCNRLYRSDLLSLLMQEGKQQGLGSIAGVADTYWGKNKGRSMEGGLVRGTIIMGVIFLCTVNRTEHYLICQGQNRSW